MFWQMKTTYYHKLHDYQLAIIVFQSVNKVRPEYFYDFFKTNSFYHPYFTGIRRI